jgi:hypothetical protein
MSPRSALFLLATLVLAQDRLEDKFYVPLDDPAIRYTQPTSDPVARLEQRLESGQAKLDYSPAQGYLPSVLHELGINIDSQVLVFSKTSIQLPKISPRTPRALYFNDEVSVGFVQGGDVLELTSLDPKQGVILYTLDSEKTDRPQFSRRDDCLKCHQGPVTLGVPGVLISSVHPRTSGPGEGHGSAYMTDQRSPLDERWGGWYVTGTHGMQKHLGNNVNLVDPLQPGGAAGPDSQNVTSLDAYFNTSRYLAPTSDIVALLTLEHQTRMTNLMTRIGWDVRINSKDPNLNSEIEEMLAYMLFTDEAPLKSPVAGVSTFTKTFRERGPRDHQGRSLRDFDLKTRLFRYPLSYMIYSPAFDGMPAEVRDRIYQRLYDILTGKDQSKAFAPLSADARRAILEIVRDTKPNLPAYWK